MLTEITLFPGITLKVFPDTRFKQGCLSVQFLRPMCRQEAAMNALLPAVLLRGCKNSPDLRSITLRLDDLYGAAIGALVRRVGDIQTTGLYCGIMDDRFSLDGDRILPEAVKFLRELLREPVTENGVFAGEYVESEKKNLISAMESQKNNKRAYASQQLLKHMCKNDSYGIPRLGEPEQVEAITPESLWAHYRKVLQESEIQLFYVGSAQPGELAEMLKPLVEGLATDARHLPLGGRLHPSEGSTQREQMDVAQGQLRLGYVTDITNSHPLFPAMQVLNALLGGGMTSKLFMNIREKMSLCYDISSGYHGAKGLFLISAGIDFDQEERVSLEIAHQLRDCREGQFTNGELEAARQWLLSQLEAVHDSPGAIENYYETAALSGLALTPECYRQAVAAVTAQDVKQAARSLRLHTSYFLRGAEQ